MIDLKNIKLKPGDLIKEIPSIDNPTWRDKDKKINFILVIKEFNEYYLVYYFNDSFDNTLDNIPKTLKNEFWDWEVI